jgi:hypothetical protein
MKLELRKITDSETKSVKYAVFKDGWLVISRRNLKEAMAFYNQIRDRHLGLYEPDKVEIIKTEIL